MSSRPFSESFSSAVRQAVIDVARKSPELTLRELLELPFVGDDAAGSITVKELLAGRASNRRKNVTHHDVTSSRAKNSPSSLNTRTGEGRQSYDAAVLAFITNTPAQVGAQEIRAEVGGTAEQLRASIQRLEQTKRVKRSGQTRATVYRAR